MSINLSYAPLASAADAVQKKAIAEQKKAAEASEKKKPSLVEILSGAGAVVGSLIGAKQLARQGGQPSLSTPGINYDYQVSQKSNKTMLIAGVIVVVVIVAIILVTRKKKA